MFLAADEFSFGWIALIGVCAEHSDLDNSFDWMAFIKAWADDCWTMFLGDLSWRAAESAWVGDNGAGIENLLCGRKIAPCFLVSDAGVDSKYTCGLDVNVGQRATMALSCQVVGWIENCWGSRREEVFRCSRFWNFLETEEYRRISSLRVCNVWLNKERTFIWFPKFSLLFYWWRGIFDFSTSMTFVFVFFLFS